MEETVPNSTLARRSFGAAVAAIVLAVLDMAGGVFSGQRHAQPLRVGYNEFSPYISVTGEGQPAGLAVDVLKEAARRSGQALVWVQVGDADQALGEGKIDVYPLIAVTGERRKRYHFSDYWWQNSLELVSSSQRPILRAADSANRTIGVRPGGLSVISAHSFFPAAKLILKSDLDALLAALCSGEIDALFTGSRSIEGYLVDRPAACQKIRLTMTAVPGGDMVLGTASTRLARNRADLLYNQVDEVVADGTMASLASAYLIPTPDISQHLAQMQQNRQRDLALEGACLGLGLLLLVFAFIGVRMRAAQKALREAQLKLEDSEQRFHAFMDHLPALAYMKDSAGRMVYVNKAYRQHIRVRTPDYLGYPTVEMLPQPVAEQVEAHDRVVLETNRAQRFTELVPDGEGRMRCGYSYRFPFRGRSGEVFLGGVSVETTEMVQMQSALRESELRYRQIVEYAGDIILRCDARGRVNYVNETAARVLRTPAERLLGRKLLELIRPDERKGALSNLRRELTEGSSDFYIELPVVTGDGSELWLGQTVRLLGNGGEFGGLQAISQDITERRRMLAQLRASEERFRLLYENGPVAYHELDRNGIIVRANLAESEMLGFPASELVGKSVLDLVAPEDRELARAAIPAKINEQCPLRPFHRTYLRADGRRLQIEIHENLVRDQAGKVIGIHSVLVDITQRRMAEVLNHDRSELSEMIAQQRPLDRILCGISEMIRHQDESLCSIPVRMVIEQLKEGEERRLEPVCPGTRTMALCQAIRELGNRAFALWPSQGFQVSHLDLRELVGTSGAALADAAIAIGLESCWSVPILSSTQNQLGILLVFSARTAQATAQGRQLLQAASRTAAIAIEHRYLTDLLAFQAAHDALTRLPNRNSFEATLETAISRARTQGQQLAVFYVDLDRFKEVNDTFGHGAGDELLRQVAVRLRRCVRQTDTLARIGGDEFSLVLPGLTDLREARLVAESILGAFHAPFDIVGRKVSITASIGISFYPQDGVDAPTLQRNSDSAMYRVKNTGKNSFRCYARESVSPRVAVN